MFKLYENISSYRNIPMINPEHLSDCRRCNGQMRFTHIYLSENAQHEPAYKCVQCGNYESLIITYNRLSQLHAHV